MIATRQRTIAAPPKTTTMRKNAAKCKQPMATITETIATHRGLMGARRANAQPPQTEPGPRHNKRPTPESEDDSQNRHHDTQSMHRDTPEVYRDTPIE